MGLSIVTPPAIEPVDFSDVMEHLRIDDNRESPTLESYIQAARRMAEHYTERQFISATWRLTADRWPLTSDGCGPCFIRLPKPPLQSVESVKYVDLDGTLQTLDDSQYEVDTDALFGRISPAWGVSWPSVRNVMNAVRVEFVAGYGDEARDVPKTAKLAILLMVGQMNENREAGDSMALSEAAKSLLSDLRVIDVAGASQ